MTTFARRLRFCIPLLVLLAALWPSASAPVAARSLGLPAGLPLECDSGGVGPSIPNSWIAVWNFNRTLTGCILFSGPESVSGKIIGYTLVPCTMSTPGSVAFSADAAKTIYNGTGYVLCPFDLADAAASATPLPDMPAVAPIAPSERLYSTFWMYAHAALSFPTVGEATNFGNPLIAHLPVDRGGALTEADMALAVPAYRAGAASARWQLAWRLRHLPPGFLSKPVYVDGATPWRSDDMTKYHTMRVTNYHLGANYLTEAAIDKVGVASTVAPGPVQFWTGRSMIYIGYAPHSGEYLHGQIDLLLIDPTGGKDPQCVC